MSLQRRQTTMGGLEVNLLGALSPDSPPELAVVLCHGYGASGTDLVSLAGEVARLRPELGDRVRFVFPAAPVALRTLSPMYGDGRAWWHIEVGRFTSAVMSGQIDDLLDDVPEGLSTARRHLRRVLDELLTQTGLPMSKVVLGGFSQGSMLAVDTALRLEEAPAALAVMSGAVMARPEWTRRVGTRRGLRVLQSHGRSDQLLPFAVAERLRDLMADAGLAVDFVPFAEGHTITGGVVERLAALVGDSLD